MFLISSETGAYGGAKRRKRGRIGVRLDHARFVLHGRNASGRQRHARGSKGRQRTSVASRRLRQFDHVTQGDYRTTY